MTIHEIELADMDAWEEFASENREALEAQYGSISSALRHAMQGGLEVGGGAAPCFVVTFADADLNDPNI